MKFNPLQIFQCGFGIDPNNAPNEVSTFRRLLPQVSDFRFDWRKIAIENILEFEKPEITTRVQIAQIIYNFFNLQILASIPQYLLSWNLGLVLAFPSIVVPSVLGNSKNLNPDEILHMTPDEATWLGKIQP